MDSVELAKSLGKDIPADALKTIEGMTSKAKILYYCRRFPMAAKAAPKVAPKAAPKPVKADEEE